MNQPHTSNTKQTESVYKLEIPELPKWLTSNTGKLLLLCYFIVFLGVGLFEGELQGRRSWIPPLTYTPFFLGGYILFSLILFSAFKGLVLPHIKSLEAFRQWRDQTGTTKVLWRTFFTVWFAFIWLMMSWGVILGAKHLSTKILSITN
jgi:hypothetical protein